MFKLKLLRNKKSEQEDRPPVEQIHGSEHILAPCHSKQSKDLSVSAWQLLTCLIWTK